MKCEQIIDVFVYDESVRYVITITSSLICKLSKIEIKILSKIRCFLRMSKTNANAQYKQEPR